MSTSADVLTFTVPSETTPGRVYTLHARAGVVTCNCQGYSARGRCKHATGATKVMAENEARDPDAPPVALVVHQAPTAMLPAKSELDAIGVIAATVFQAKGFLPEAITSPAQAAAIMLAGWEVGLRPMTALRHVYMVNGRTELETRAMMGVVRAKDPRIQFQTTEYTQEAVTVTMHRPGQTPTTVRYTVDDAKRSGQLAKSGPWQKYTRDMLFAAAAKRVCRIGAPDLINAIDSSMVSVDDAASMTLPDVRIIEHEPLAPGAIPDDAYNEGDDRETIPAEVAAAAPVAPPEASAEWRSADPGDDVRALMFRLTGEVGAQDQTKIRAALAERWPAAFFKADDGIVRMRLRELSLDEQAAMAKYLHECLDGEEPGTPRTDPQQSEEPDDAPPLPSDADAEQGAL